MRDLVVNCWGKATRDSPRCQNRSRVTGGIIAFGRLSIDMGGKGPVRFGALDYDSGRSFTRSEMAATRPKIGHSDQLGP